MIHEDEVSKIFERSTVLVGTTIHRNPERVLRLLEEQDDVKSRCFQCPHISTYHIVLSFTPTRHLHTLKTSNLETALEFYKTELWQEFEGIKDASNAS